MAAMAAMEVPLAPQEMLVVGLPLRRLLGVLEALLALLAELVELLVSMEPVAEVVVVEVLDLLAPAARVVLVVRQEEAVVVVAALAPRVDQAALAPPEKYASGLGSCSPQCRQSVGIGAASEAI